MKSHKTRLGVVAAAAATLFVGMAQAAQPGSGEIYMLRAEAVLTDHLVGGMIVAGDPNGTPPDSPALRVDPNVPTSPFTGVVSINTRYWGLNPNTGNFEVRSFICSGAMVSPIHIVTAAHCIDTNGQGTPVVLGDPTAQQVGVGDVRGVFNVTGSGAGAGVLTATSITMHPNYHGFGVCPAAVTNPDEFCINDDIAVVTLGSPAPEGAAIYRMARDVSMNTMVTHVGYGTSGNGVNGFTVNPSFRVKRVGWGHIDRPLDELDDEQNFVGGMPEVWSADFDSAARGIDTHCTLFGVCSPILANNVETTLGGGDSGGPTFTQLATGEYVLVGNNTFGRRFTASQVSGTFGTGYGGMLLGAYEGFLQTATGGQIQVVPEPETYALMLLGLAGMGAVVRRRRAAQQA